MRRQLAFVDVAFGGEEALAEDAFGVLEGGAFPEGVGLREEDFFYEVGVVEDDVTLAERGEGADVAVFVGEFGWEVGEGGFCGGL